MSVKVGIGGDTQSMDEATEIPRTCRYDPFPILRSLVNTLSLFSILFLCSHSVAYSRGREEVTEIAFIARTENFSVYTYLYYIPILLSSSEHESEKERC